MPKIDYIKLAKKAASIQITELKKIKKTFDGSFIRALEAISSCKERLLQLELEKVD